MKLSRRNFLGGSAVALASVAAIGGRGASRSHTGGADHRLARDAAADAAAIRPGLSAGGDAERLDAALAHERRVEGVPSRRRAGDPRIRARHDGQSVGL